jgi:hypothetical protein
MKLTNNELNELKYHYVDRVVDNMSTKDLVQYVFDDMLIIMLYSIRLQFRGYR